MPVAIGIDARHLTAKEPAVRGCVTKLIDRDIIMDHLMEDEVFGEVDARVDAEDEVLVAKRSKEPRAAGKSHFAEEGARVREFDRNRWQGRSKETCVELVKAGLYVRDGGGQ